MINLTIREQFILKIIHYYGETGVGWYSIEIKLSNMDVPRQPNLFTNLNNLEDKGLVNRLIIDDPDHPKWAITDAGRLALEQMKDK